MPGPADHDEMAGGNRLQQSTVSGLPGAVNPPQSLVVVKFDDYDPTAGPNPLIAAAADGYVPASGCSLLSPPAVRCFEAFEPVLCCRAMTRDPGSATRDLG